MIKINTGSNQYYLAFAVEYLNGDGDIGSMYLIPPNSNGIAMKQSFGGTWAANIPKGVRGPYSVSLTTIESGQKLYAKNVIPADWVVGARYQASGNIPV